MVAWLVRKSTQDHGQAPTFCFPIPKHHRGLYYHQPLLLSTAPLPSPSLKYQHYHVLLLLLNNPIPWHNFIFHTTSALTNSGKTTISDIFQNYEDSVPNQMFNNYSGPDHKVKYHPCLYLYNPKYPPIPYTSYLHPAQMALFRILDTFSLFCTPNIKLCASRCCAPGMWGIWGDHSIVVSQPDSDFVRAKKEDW